MLKKIITGFLILSTTTLFAMSLSQLNSASKAELMQINGIGEAKAGAILKERKKGKFKSFEDFQRVEGIGVQTAANVKNNTKSKADVKKVKKPAKKKSTEPKPTKTKTKPTKTKPTKKKTADKKPTKKTSKD